MRLIFSHLVQFEESFVEQLEKHYPRLLKKLAKKKVRESLVEKARKKILTSSRALMDNVVPVITRAKSKEEKEFAEGLLEIFRAIRDMPAEEVLKKFEKKFPKAKKMCSSSSKRSLTLRTTLSRCWSNSMPTICRAFPQKARALEKSLGDLRSAVAAKLRAVARVGT